MPLKVAPLKSEPCRGVDVAILRWYRGPALSTTTPGRRLVRLKPLLKRIIPARYWPTFVLIVVRARYRLLQAWYRGNDVECPLCRGEFRRFLPDRLDVEITRTKHVVGAGYAYSNCPKCHANYRERLLYLYLRAHWDQWPPGARILHIAPERNVQRFLRDLRHVRYLSADLDSPLADEKLDITHIDYADETFDVIICNHVLEHVSDDKMAMRELFRVLKTGGFAILQVPLASDGSQTEEDPRVTSPAERERRYGQSDHLRLYGSDYTDRLSGAGFSVDRFSPAEIVGEWCVRRYGLQPEEMLHIAFKRAARGASGPGHVPRGGGI